MFIKGKSKKNIQSHLQIFIHQTAPNTSFASKRLKFRSYVGICKELNTKWFPYAHYFLKHEIKMFFIITVQTVLGYVRRWK